MNEAEGVGDDASARWLAVHDELLRGITHALSNRIATVSASSYMFEHGDVPLAQMVQSLAAEAEKMDHLLQQLRLLPQRPGAEAEPVTANDACNSAIKLHAHHGELRDFVCEVTVAADVYPVWVEPQSFGHALLVALTTAKRNAQLGTRVLLNVSGNNDVVHFSAVAEQPRPSTDTLNALDARAAAWLLARHGGNARALDHGCELEVPTLLAIRRARKS